jgi:hypothetical protein
MNMPVREAIERLRWDINHQGDELEPSFYSDIVTVVNTLVDLDEHYEKLRSTIIDAVLATA